MPETKLTIELVPATSWFTNVRSLVSKEEWDGLRKSVYRSAQYRCQICGGRGEKWPIECHEQWRYDDDCHTQTLIGMIGLCPNCHRVKHFGLARIKGEEEQALLWLMRVNGWSLEAADEHIRSVFSVWKERSRVAWNVDISYLDRYKKGCSNKSTGAFRPFADASQARCLKSTGAFIL